MFCKSEFRSNMELYMAARREVAAAASGQIQLASRARDALEDQARRGRGYTPPYEMGWGSANAAQIAEMLLGRSLPTDWILAKRKISTKPRRTTGEERARAKEESARAIMLAQGWSRREAEERLGR